MGGNLFFIVPFRKYDNPSKYRYKIVIIDEITKNQVFGFDSLDLKLKVDTPGFDHPGFILVLVVLSKDARISHTSGNLKTRNHKRGIMRKIVLIPHMISMNTRNS